MARMRHRQSLGIRAGQKKIQSATKGVDVALCDCFASELLGRDIRLLAHQGAGCRSDKFICRPEVDQNERTSLFFHEIVGTYIPVDDGRLGSVQVLQNLRNLDAPIKDSLLALSTILFYQLAQILP